MAFQKQKEKPSKVTKDRLSGLVEQSINESGKVAKQLVRHSGSREVLLKAAKKTASQEVAMEHTLANLRQMEKLLNSALQQANSIGQSMEQTSVVKEQLQAILDQ